MVTSTFPKDPTNSENVCFAKDGLTFDGKHLERAQDAGALNVITAPLSRGFLQGVSVAFKTGATSVLQKDAVIQEQAALHFSIGHQAQGGSTPSISSQISLLEKFLLTLQMIQTLFTAVQRTGKYP